MTKKGVPERPPPPAWLDAAFIQRALRNEPGSSAAVVRSISVRHANKIGENYVSEMYRVAATLQDSSQRSLIVKCPPAGEQFQAVVLKSRVFVTEGDMFTKVVPGVEAELEAVAPGRFQPFAARCLLRGTEPTHFLVFQDLMEQGFKTADRKVGLDMDHTLLVLRSLARYHAGSLPLLDREREDLDAIPNFFHEPVVALFESASKSSFQAMASQLRGWPESEWKRYAQACEDLVDKAFPMFQDAVESKEGRFEVMLHGDSWVNNLLFRYENGKPRDLRFVDYQLSHIGSPAADILYFLYSSLNDEIASKGIDFFVREYYKTLTETLDLLGLGHRAPSYKELQQDIAKCGGSALIGGFVVMPITRSGGEDNAYDMESSMKEKEDGKDSLTSSFFGDEAVVRAIKRMLPDCRARGWLPITSESS